MMSKTTTKIYRGFLDVRDWGESEDVLFLDYNKIEQAQYPLADIIEEDMEEAGNFLTVRYWITEGEAPDDEIKMNMGRIAMGDSEVQFDALYSEYTGYLWTEEAIKIGGHDLLEEFKRLEGYYCLLEIEYNEEVPK